MGRFGSKLGMKLELLPLPLHGKRVWPVKVILTREEEFLTISRHESRTIIKTGVTRDGRIISREVTIYLNTGAYADFGPIVSKNIWFYCWRSLQNSNVKIDSYCVYTNKVPAGAMRGFGVHRWHGPTSNNST